MKKGLKWFDAKLIKLINANIKSDFLDRFMLRFTNLGGVLSTTVFVLILLFFGNREGKIIGIQGTITLVISQTITYGLKSLLSRERPYNILKGLNTFDIILKDYSFPSGHTSASFAIATTVALNIPKLSIVVFIIALIIGVSRIYLGVHYPTDVVAGMILGIGSAIVTHIYLVDCFLEYFIGLINT
ncbi:MAG: phosphatase PAP2 family protein [Tissierellia bacterium]|nr:phosphatase PAP2 family protein [Tissierellia bacterium]